MWCLTVRVAWPIGIAPTPVAAVLPDYMGCYRPGGQSPTAKARSTGPDQAQARSNQADSIRPGLASPQPAPDERAAKSQTVPDKDPEIGARQPASSSQWQQAQSQGTAAPRAASMPSAASPRGQYHAFQQARPGNGGIDSSSGNRAAASLSNPKNRAAVMVTPDRDAPGMSARHCASPMAIAGPKVISPMVRVMRPIRSAAITARQRSGLMPPDTDIGQPSWISVMMKPAESPAGWR